MNRVIVFVQLGSNPAPMLNSMASSALALLPDSELILLTDDPGKWGQFPGRIVQYVRRDVDEWINRIERDRPDLQYGSNGYWLRTLERIFALGAVAEAYPSAEILHFEGDVLSLVDSDVIEALRLRTSIMAVPRLRSDAACASILYAGSGKLLDSALSGLRRKMEELGTWIDDMSLLGIGVQEGIIEALPNSPTDAWEIRQDPDGTKHFYLFDALALGQYLFGQDPFHTQGRRISGHQRPDYDLAFEECEWGISERHQGGVVAPYFRYRQNTYWPANVHLHAKMDPGPLRPTSDAWRQAILEANGQAVRQPGPYVRNEIHNVGVPLRVRFEAARRRGLGRSISLSLKSHLSNIGPRLWS